MYAYLDNFSSLFDENPSAMYSHHFAKFEEMVQKCAAAAVRDTRIAWKNNSDSLADIDLNVPLINKIISAYKNSRVGMNLKDFYIRRVRDEFTFLAIEELKRSCHNQEHYDLILPVIFFRCIMLNEFNPESVKNREEDLKNQLTEDELTNSKDLQWPEWSADNFDAYFADEKWAKRKSKWIKTYDSGGILTVKLYQLKTRKKSFYKVISAAEKEAVKVNFRTNNAVPPAVRIACTGFFPLKDQYETVKRCSEYARIGCFLYDLLEATANKEQPLDTILRLYMIAEVHDVLSCTGYLIRGEAYPGKTNEKEQPLSRFDKVTGKQLMHYASEDIPAQTIKLLHDTEYQKYQFLPFYDHLYKNYTFNAPEILEFYLDKTILDPCIGVDEEIRKYAANVKSLVSKLPYYEHTVSHAKTAIRMTNLFREDKLQESYENSEDYATFLEASELLNS